MREPKIIEVEGWAVVQALKGQPRVKGRVKLHRLATWAMLSACGAATVVTGGLHVAVHALAAWVGVRCPL